MDNFIYKSLYDFGDKWKWTRHRIAFKKHQDQAHTRKLLKFNVFVAEMLGTLL